MFSNKMGHLMPNTYLLLPPTYNLTTYLLTNPPTHLPICNTYLPTHRPAHLPSYLCINYLTTYPTTHLPKCITSLPTYPPTYNLFTY